MFLKLLISCFLHFFLLKAVLDSYFRTILEQDLPLTNTTKNPPAKRVVLIVVDGLGANAIYGNNTSSTPFFTSLRRTRASWGISIGAPPTESRVGHVALIAGFREDPRAIITFWNSYPVKYESVIEHSNHAWVYPGVKGMNTILGMYTTGNAKFYDPPEVKSTKVEGRIIKGSYAGVDEWSVQTLETSLNNSMNEKNLTESGNLFVVCLQEMDSYGHRSEKNYSRNLPEVDEKVARISSIVDGFFKDNSTAFLFTADHGMFRGHHGGNSKEVLSAPFIAWGAGIKPDPFPKNLNNIDVAPLISVLSGIPFPTNSHGILPIDYLNINNSRKLSFLSKNLIQVLTIYKAKQESIYKIIFHQRKTLDVEGLKQELLTFQEDDVVNFEKSVNRCKIIYFEIKTGIQRIHYYLICDFLFLSFIYLLFWILYLFLCLIPDLEKKETSKIRIEMIIMIYHILVLFSHCFLELFPVLCVLPFGTIYLCLSKVGKIRNISKESLQSFPLPQMFCFAFFILSMALALHSSFLQSLTSLSMAFTIYVEKQIWTNSRIREVWIVLCLILSGFPFITDRIEWNMDGTTYYFVGSFIWHFFIASILLNFFKNRDSLFLTRSQKTIYFIQLLCSTYCSFSSFFDEVHQETIIFISLLVPILTIPLSMKSPDVRLVTIFMAFATVYVVNGKPFSLIFLTFFSMFLFSWKIMETEKLNSDFINIRNTWVMIGLNFIGFLGILHYKDIFEIIGTFDGSGLQRPIAHVTRIFTPVILSCCVFRYLVPKIGINFKFSFICMEVIFGLLLFHSMSSIENEDDWGTIGTTVLRFNIANFFSLTITFFYCFSYILMNIDCLGFVRKLNVFF